MRLYFKIIFLFVFSSVQVFSQKDNALSPPILNFAPSSEYDFTNRKWQGIPTIERTVDGTLWAAWYSGASTEGNGNYVVLVMSRDDGISWSKPILVVTPVQNTRVFDPCLWFNNDKLWLFWAQSYTRWDGRAGVWAISFSVSGNDIVYSDPQRLCDGIMMNKPLKLKDGTILIDAAIWKEVSQYNSLTSGVYVYKTNDKDLFNLNLLSINTMPNQSIDESMLVEKNDGSLWMTDRFTNGVAESFSYDQGNTWTIGRKSTLFNADARFHIRRLASGNLLFIHHLPPNNAANRSHLTASLSLDDGLTWPYNLLIDERSGVSYPDAIQDEGGRIHMIYDYDRYGQKNIITCHFIEQDIIDNIIPVKTVINEKNSTNVIFKRNITTLSQDTTHNISIICQSGIISIDNNDSKIIKVFLVNSDGCIVKSLSDCLHDTSLSIQVTGFKGVYILKIMTTSNVIVRKLKL